MEGGREKSKVYRDENKEAIEKKRNAPVAIENRMRYYNYNEGGGKEKSKMYYDENKEAMEKKRNAPAAMASKKRYDHERRQDKLEAAHTKNKRKGKFVRKIYETKEPSKKKQLKEASQQIKKQRKEAPAKTTTSTSSSGRKRQLPARINE